MANITEQISYAELKEKDLPGGIICIGGGVKLNGMTELISRQLGLPVKIGHLPSYVVIDDLKGPSTEIVQVGSILYAGATLTDEQCLELPRQQEMPVMGEANTPDEQIADRRKSREGRQTNPDSVINKFKRFTSKLFSSPEDDDDSSLLE